MDASQSRSASDNDSTGGHCTFYFVWIPAENSITQLSFMMETLLCGALYLLNIVGKYLLNLMADSNKLNNDNCYQNITSS